MNAKRPIRYGIGWIILDCILLIDTINDLRTGRMTWVTLLTIMVVSVTLAILLVALARRCRNKEREQTKFARTEESGNTDHTE